MSALDADGSERWNTSVDGRLGTPAVTDERVYAATTESTVRAFDVADGTATGRREIDGEGRFSPAIADESLYVVSGNGSLYAFE